MRVFVVFVACFSQLLYGLWRHVHEFQRWRAQPRQASDQQGWPAPASGFLAKYLGSGISHGQDSILKGGLQGSLIGFGVDIRQVWS